MSANPYPWLVLLGIVVFVLAYRGWLARLGVPPRRVNPPAPQFISSQPSPPANPAATVAGLTAAQLGELFVRASRQEHEARMMSQLAQAQHDSIGQIFTHPFPLPGSTPNPADPGSKS